MLAPVRKIVLVNFRVHTNSVQSRWGLLNTFKDIPQNRCWCIQDTVEHRVNWNCDRFKRSRKDAYKSKLQINCSFEENLIIKISI